MASKRLRPFCAVGHTCLSIAACGGPALLLCGSSHQGTLLICPHFSCFTLKITAQSRRTKKVYKGPEKLAQNFVFLWHPRLFSPRHQICVSHINFCHEWRNTSKGQEATIRIQGVKGDVRFRATKCLEHPNRKGHKGTKQFSIITLNRPLFIGLYTPRSGNESVFLK